MAFVVRSSMVKPESQPKKKVVSNGDREQAEKLEYVTNMANMSDGGQLQRPQSHAKGAKVLAN